jgi:hypothetical protein
LTPTGKIIFQTAKRNLWYNGTGIAVDTEKNCEEQGCEAQTRANKNHETGA